MFNHTDTFLFSGGEVHVKSPAARFYPEAEETFHLWSSDSIMELLLYNEIAIRAVGRHEMRYAIPYVPYARQDRVTSDREPLSITVMADILNGLDAKSIKIYDPHSDVTPALIRNCRVIHQHELVNVMLGHKRKSWDGIVAPDAGATKKAEKLATLWQLPLYQGLKKRDTNTGEISRTYLTTNPRDGDRLLVVDDICDGGRTFTELADAIQRYANVELDLFVSHGIFSKGTDELHKRYEDIYCYNLKPRKNGEQSIFVLKP